MNRVIAAERRAAAAMGGAPMQLRATSAVAADDGCFQIQRDSTPWLSGVPQRFALTRDESTGRNVVRSVSEAGIVDSTIAGGEWRAIPPARVLVQFSAARPVSLSFATGGQIAQASSGAENRVIGVRRVICRP